MNFWIGLVRGDRDCRCYTLDQRCLECRSTFLWVDGTPMIDYDGWKAATEPGMQDCAIVTRSGWADISCVTYDFQYICKLFIGKR